MENKLSIAEVESGNIIISANFVIMKRIMGLILLLSVTVFFHGAEAVTDNGTFNKLQVRRLHDLSIPRGGCQIAVCDGEPVVFGGHTTGFIPTPTAEYCHKGRWRCIPMLYSHDHALSVSISSRGILLAGGNNENFGIGQSFDTELYFAGKHCFRPLPIIDRRRTMGSALELVDGRILISGNWYAGDSMEIYNPDNGNVEILPVSQGRARPGLFLVSPSDAIVFGQWGNYDETIGDIIIDRLRGDSYREPLLNTWHPHVSFQN